jgi:hypothetical protein
MINDPTTRAMPANTSRNTLKNCSPSVILLAASSAACLPVCTLIAAACAPSAATTRRRSVSCEIPGCALTLMEV